MRPAAKPDHFRYFLDSAPLNRSPKDGVFFGAGAALRKFASLSAASHVTADHAATFWSNVRRSILSRLSSALWCKSK